MVMELSEEGRRGGRGGLNQIHNSFVLTLLTSSLVVMATSATVDTHVFIIREVHTKEVVNQMFFF